MSPMWDFYAGSNRQSARFSPWTGSQDLWSTHPSAASSHRAMIHSGARGGCSLQMAADFSSETTCFLCHPSPDLVYAENEDGVALCGLGPLVEGYSVVGTKLHMAS